jgi:hypothetical protein
MINNIKMNTEKSGCVCVEYKLNTRQNPVISSCNETLDSIICSGEILKEIRDY